MATFFDKKQDVIDIELTKYGEYLLSLGKFNPVYYSFFDDNVLYDSRYAAFSASQNSFEPRIQENTPSLRAISSYEGRETQILEHNRVVANNPRLREDQQIRFQSTPDRHFTSLVYPLGHSDLSSVKAPAWSMRFYNSEIKNVDVNLTGSRAAQRIPQVTATIKYETQIKSKMILPDGESGEFYQPTDGDIILQEGIFGDGSFVIVEPDYILLDLQEINSPYERENFDVEVYEIKDETLKNGDVVEQWIPLKFKKKKQEIVNNLLVDNPKSSQSSNQFLDHSSHRFPHLDPSFAEYFFDVFADNEIDNVIMCKSLNRLRARGIYIETEFNCPDIQDIVSPVSPYSTLDIESVVCEDDIPGGGG